MLSVAEVLQQMQHAVKSGKLQEASSLGEQCVLPLSIPSTSITFHEVISEGAESQVFRGEYHQQSVAIKKPYIRTTQDLERFREELKLNALLDHPNVVPVIGARVVPPNYYFVMPKEGSSYYDSTHHTNQQIGWKEVIRVAMEISSALAHIHSKGIIHRDVKTRNILRGSEGNSKLIDFGIAQLQGQQEIEVGSKPTGGFHKQKMIGTLEYMSPEVLQKAGHSFSSDVYSLAVCVNEIATGIFPFSDCNKDNPEAHTVLEMGYGRQELAVAVAAEGLTPTLPKNSPGIFTDLMKACWNLNPDSRPSINQLYTQFKSMYGAFDQLDFPIFSTRLSVAPVQDHDGVVECYEEVEGEWKVEIEGGNYVPQISCGVYATAGFRGEDRMEDRHLIETSFCGHEEISLISVFDGHRGIEASDFAFKNLSPILNHHLKIQTTPSSALQQAFLDLEGKFERRKEAEINEPRGMRYPGCTALSALILKDQLFLANVGDCRAVLCQKGVALQLTRDHTALDGMERLRVQKTGAEILWQKGSWRISPAGIQVTRSLGDVDLKPSIVCADPEITTNRLTVQDEFLIVATDGLWDALNNEEAVQLVQDTVKNPDLCAKRLATEALTRGSQDNITVIVMFLKPVTTLEQVFYKGISKYKTGLRAKKENHHKTKTPIAADEIFETL